MLAKSDLEHVYDYAKALCRGLPELYQEDIIQEAVIAVWQGTERYKYTTKGLWHKTIFKAVNNARRAYKKRFQNMCALREDDMIREGLDVDVLPVPTAFKDLMLAVVENDFNIPAAAKALKMSQRTAYKKWQAVCLLLKNEMV